jgi:hypothetical protein
MSRCNAVLRAALLLALMSLPAAAQVSSGRITSPGAATDNSGRRCRVVVVSVDNSRWDTSCMMRPGSFLQTCTRTYVPGMRLENRTVCD